MTKFNGFGQQDAAELVNYLLDILHEDLNRITDKPYIEFKDSFGRPDKEVAEEYWKGIIARNDSVVTDLMYGQFKSKVVCKACEHENSNFDAFLTLQLPIPKKVYIEVVYQPAEMMNTETKEKNPHLRTKFTTEREETVQNMKKMINERLGREEDLVAYNIYRGCIRSRHLASTEIGEIEQKNELTIFTPREKEKEG